MVKLQDELAGGQMNTLSEAMNILVKQGYKDFRMTDLGMACKETGEVFRPGDLVIKKVFRFEGESNPEDMSILYALEANSGTKGMFIDAFGTYGDYDSQEVTEFFREVKREANP